ncbi:kinesin-like protein Klp59C [Drosophila kikkawai]|uniref:Kinesin-like protein n=1 Tax=Drosophila kikkawai TaxID=30033 RepID=A0A6P4I7U0_DROKI|nr:kinesin-like protein Klp59C [Drosophila kikkawai]
MDQLSINQKVFIRRSDGRVHLGSIIKLDGGTNNIVTVEWPEGHTVRGKELPLELVILMNPQIYDTPRYERLQANQTASIPPRALVGARNQAGVMPRQGAEQLMTPNRQDEVVLQINKLQQQRERRRELYNRERLLREQQMNEDPGNPNWEIARMIRLHRQEMSNAQKKTKTAAKEPPKEHQIIVCVRKRPLNQKELADKKELDVVSIHSRDHLVVHEPRKHVNLVKFLENHSFRFDYAFNENCSNAFVYEFTARPLIRHIFDGGMATCFAYGQTGSGKTHTMGGKFTGRNQQNSLDGIYAMATRDVFSLVESPAYVSLNLRVFCSFFEIYGSRVYDLLVTGKPQLKVLEDGHQQVQVVGLTENAVKNVEDVLNLLDLGNSVRTSGQTSANSKSSRSHAVFQIVLRKSSSITERPHGKFSLIDLAGNERGADNNSVDRLTRLEGSDINKSLLVLKECIRALGRQSAHLPFRGSKLTQVLRDSFIGGKKVKTCMIAMISPGLHSVEHTLNTLRYADRVKELTVDSLIPRRLMNTPLANPADAPPASNRNSLPDVRSQREDEQAYPVTVASSNSLSGGQGRGPYPTVNRSQRRSRHPRAGSRSHLARNLSAFRGRNLP